MVRQVELKTVGMLMDVIRRGAESLRQRGIIRMSVSPNGGTLLTHPEGVRVLENGVNSLFRCQPRFDGEGPAIQAERIFRQRIVHVRRREEAAIPIRPGAELAVRKAEKTRLLALDVQLQFVVVLIEYSPPVQG